MTARADMPGWVGVRWAEGRLRFLKTFLPAEAAKEQLHWAQNEQARVLADLEDRRFQRSILDTFRDPTSGQLDIRRQMTCDHTHRGHVVTEAYYNKMHAFCTYDEVGFVHDGAHVLDVDGTHNKLVCGCAP